MASKEKIKKKKSEAHHRIKHSEKDAELQESTSERKLIADLSEPSNLDQPSGIITVQSNGTEENQKDAGREKERSDTPSPPPAETSSLQNEKDILASPEYKHRRSPSPFPNNKVEPLPSGSGDISNPGSVVSLRSGTPVKEAWTENGADKKRPDSAASRVSRLSKNSTKDPQQKKPSVPSDALSLKSEHKAEQNAYIPYLYARGCIMRITEDMKAMKEKHIRIVHDIEAHYRSLEGESQTQFMAFVAKYRDKFAGKLDTCRLYIEQHRQEVLLNEEKWKQEIESLNERNTKLLEEKNEALSQSKTDMEKMDAEVAALKTELSVAVGAAGAAELAQLQNENQALKEEVSNLQKKSIDTEVQPVGESVRRDSVSLVAAVPVPISEGRDNKHWADQVHRLQEEVTQLRLDNAQLTASNEALKIQLQGTANLAERFAALENQYKALAVVAVTSPETKAAAEANLEKTKDDENMMKEEQKRLQGEIDEWEKKFVKQNKRQPSEDDKPDSVKELYVQKEEATQMLTSLGQQKETLTQLKSGVAPPVPEIAAAAVVQEPEIQTVEVKVPDPEVVAALESSQQEVEELRLRLADLSVAGAAVFVGGTDDQADKADLDAANAALLQEQAAHDNTKAELEDVQKQLEIINETLSAERAGIESKLESYKGMLETKIATKDEEIARLKTRNEELEEERLKNVPVDTAKEIKNLQNKISLLESEKSSASVAQAGVAAQLSEMSRKLKLSEEAVEKGKVQQAQLEERLKIARKEKDEAVRDLTKLLSRRDPGRPMRQKSQVGETTSGRGDVAALKRENQELNQRIKQLEKEVTFGGAALALGAAGAGGDRNVQKRHEKILKEIEKKFDMERAKTSKLSENLKIKEEQATTLQKDLNKREAEVARLTAELSALGVAAKEGVEAATKVKALEKENKKLLDENKVLTENYNSERVLRKKYYNMVEDMKGKIRVYCRARPLSSSEKGRGNHSVLNSVDEYTISVNSQRGVKEFQFDQVFMEDSTQEQIFEDTNNLIQSAFDGYNVCIFAYGQTGSGKTFTMIGDSGKSYPGIAPRAFQRIFDLAEENKSKFKISVSVYMMELYNDRLIDLLAKPGTSDDEKMEIKKDKKGLVFVQGAVVKSASNAKELTSLFEEGSLNRHTASTKMNAESSRSHLILSIVMESENKSTGAILKGKLSLVDLAGSERVGKTGATAEQLKEAMSINKSLSALGDVISALSSEQSFIPYRNHKLTMLMQDSLGGNAKTLMFVNISPADYNMDESVISLTYASRVKLITNDASKNADNKEIARLKSVIAKLKKGEQVEEEEA